MYETSITGEEETSSAWNNGISRFNYTESLVSRKGNYLNDTKTASIFSFARDSGNIGLNISWRASLTLFL